MKAAELRQAILHSAAQGKLVPQCVHDEPAERLLERIQQEKMQLVKNYIIKKEKPLPLISEDEIPYDLPDRWVWCRLADLCSHIADIDHNMPRAVEQGGVLFLSAKDLLDNGTINYTDKVKFISETDYERLSKKVQPKKNDIIYSRIGACLGKARIVDSDIRFLVSYSCCTIRSLMVNLQYLCRYLDSGIVLEQATRDTQSIGVPDLGLKKIKEFLVPLPPIEEQQRIVNKVHELMTLCDMLEAAERDLNALETRFAEYLPKSILQAAVQGKLVPQNVHDEPASELLARIRQEKARLIKEGKIKKEKPFPPIAEDEIPFDLPDGWVWCRLGDMVQLINGDRGKNYPSKEKLSTNGIPFISALNIENGTISASKLLCVSQEQYDLLGSGKLAKDDIVFCIRGSLGKCGLYPFEQGAIASSLVILRQLKADNCALRYLFIYTASPLIAQEIIAVDNGTAQPNLSAENLKNFLLPLPPPAEQRRIVAQVDNLMSMCDELKAAQDTVIKPTTENVIQFPRHTPQDDGELHFAARGDGLDLPQEAFDDLAALWGDDNDA